MINVEGLMNALSKAKNVNVNIYDGDDLKISFKSNGFNSLEKTLLNKEIEKISISSINNIYVYLKQTTTVEENTDFNFD